MSRLRSLWRNLLRRDQIERRLDEELNATLELLVDEKVAAGAPPEAARRAARIELGNVDAIKDYVRDRRSGALIDTLLQDVRYGARLLRRNPLFTLTAALSLAIGIGATTTIFTAANGLLLRSAVGVRDPDGLVDIVRLERGDSGVEPISYPDYLDLRGRVTTLDAVYGYQLELEPISLRVTDTAERAFASVVTANYFQALGVPPAAGRLFGPGDSEASGASPVAVLSHRFWTRRFNADPGVVGQIVRVNSHPFMIAGVAREDFRGTSVLAPDLWIPAAMVGVVQPGSDTSRLRLRENGWLMLGGRLKPGVSRVQASAEVAAIGEALAREFPFDPRYLPPGVPNKTFAWSAQPASPIPYGLRGMAATFLVLLMALVSIVLVIACANIAGILLMRATVRRREIGIRAAIGAGRLRIVRQLLTETTLLFALGGAMGLAVARVLTSLLVALLPAYPLPVSLSVPLDVRVFAFSLGLSLIAAVLSGLAPALHASNADVVSALKDDTGGPPDRLRARNAFVVVQVALSVLLIVIAGTLVRGFDRVTSVDRGFDSRGVDVVSLDLSMAGYTDATGAQFGADLIERVRSLPGVEAATLASGAPGQGIETLGGVTVPGVTPPNGAPFFYPSWILLESGYFSTLRIPLVAGRDFRLDDREGSERVAIVGEGAARRFWPGREAVGQFLMIHTANPSSPTAVAPTRLRVVGVARDVISGASRREGPLALYVPLRQRYTPRLTILARTDGRASLAGSLHVLVASMDPNLPVLSAQTLESQQNGPGETRLRIGAVVAGGMGLVGLLLAGIGVYGVTAYAVTRRTREIGIRLSLGANRLDVVGLVLRQGLYLVGIGSATGIALAAWVGRVLSGSNVGVPPPDAVIFAEAAALFIAIGLTACSVPVLRATRIRAMDALRHE
jgi:predicted permease